MTDPVRGSHPETPTDIPMVSRKERNVTNTPNSSLVGAMVLAVSTAIGGPAARCGDVCGVRADKIGGLARRWTLAVECLRERLV